MSPRRRIVVVLAATLISSSLSAQNPPRDARTAPTSKAAAPSGTGLLSGRVTTDDDTQPIRFAAVVLLGVTTGVVKVTSTDADGRFSFASLPADRFTVGASKLPYLGAVAGARRPARPGTPIALGDGQKVTNVAIRLPRGAAISGTITDEQGQPASHALATLQQWRMVNGERRLVGGAGTVQTDDRGRYRFFGLTPGEYVVAAYRPGLPPTQRMLSAAEVDAALQGNVMSAAAAAPQPPLRYAPSYFPGTPRVDDAVSIVLGAGEDRGGVDIRIITMPVARIEGVLTSADGQPVAGGNVMVMSTSVLTTATVVRTTPDGRFAAPNLLPGQYAIFVTGSGTSAGRFGHQTVEVMGTDVTGVQLVLRPSLTLPGRLVFESSTANAVVAGRRAPVRVLGPNMAGRPAPSSGPADDVGAFQITNLTPGRYMFGGPIALGPSAETMSWSLASAVLDGTDVTDRAVEISLDAPPKQLTLSYTDRVQELSGRLQSQSGAPVSDYTIVVFPEDRAYWIPNTRRIVTTRPGTDGRFALSGPGPTTLPPGRYLLAAVTDLDRDEQFDPAFLAQLVPAGVPITLGPGEKKVQDLAIK